MCKFIFILFLANLTHVLNDSKRRANRGIRSLISFISNWQINFHLVLSQPQVHFKSFKHAFVILHFLPKILILFLCCVGATLDMF